MSTDEAIAAANRLGMTVPSSRAVAANISNSGYASCPTCESSVQYWTSCGVCGQMLQWGWVHDEIEHLIEIDKGPETTDQFMAILSHWPTTLLIKLSSVTRRELCTVLAENDRRHRVEVRRRCAEELDRRSARGIEDD